MHKDTSDNLGRGYYRNYANEKGKLLILINWQAVIAKCSKSDKPESILWFHEANLCKSNEADKLYEVSFIHANGSDLVPIPLAEDNKELPECLRQINSCLTNHPNYTLQPELYTVIARRVETNATS